MRDPRSYAFPLATFHVCLLVLAFIALGYPDLGGLADLNTLLGLVIFALLWAATYYGTRWALGDPRVNTLEIAIIRGFGGGARSGLLVVVAGLLPTVILASVTDPLAGLLFVAIYGTIGALVAAVVGGTVGFAFGLIDWILLTMVGGGAWHGTQEEVADA